MRKHAGMVSGLNRFRFDRVHQFRWFKFSKSWPQSDNRLSTLTGGQGSLSLNDFGFVDGVNSMYVCMYVCKYVCMCEAGMLVDKPNTLVSLARPLFGLVFIGSDWCTRIHPADLHKSNDGFWKMTRIRGTKVSKGHSCGNLLKKNI